MAKNPLQLLLARLEDHKFTVELRTELFGEPLPNLRAIAIDDLAHQLVLVAEESKAPEDRPDTDPDLGWRELLFAVAGLRHHLRGSGSPALGSPVLLALVDGKGKAKLRELVEDIAQRYALFSRADINIVLHEDTGSPESLDGALTSLLPCLRQTLKEGRTVAAQDVEEFWEELSQEIDRSAAGLAKAFNPEVADESKERIWRVLREAPDEVRELDDSVPPIPRLALANFRSFRKDEVKIPAVAIVHGANGSGKTSICEALEILWAGRSQRIPEGVSAKTYEKHLRRHGQGFHLEGSVEGRSDPLTAEEITDLPRASLGRTVLPQEAVGKMAGSSPQERFRAFLLASGMQLPDFEERVTAIRKQVHEEANGVLAQAGLGRIRAVNAPGLETLEAALEADFAADLPADLELAGAVKALSRVSNGAFANQSPLQMDASQLHALVEAAESALRRVQRELEGAPDPAPAVEAAVRALNKEAENLTRRGVALQQLLDQLRIANAGEPDRDAVPPPTPPVPPRAAARWLANVRGIEQSVSELDALKSEILDQLWQGRLQRYLEALRGAVDISSAKELEAIAEVEQGVLRPRARTVEPVPEQLLRDAGFVRTPDCSPATIAAIGELQGRLVDFGSELGRLAGRLKNHPGPAFSARAPRILRALCDFELVRDIAQPTGAVTRARETLVSRLLDDRLTPLVRELVAAFVRFEWYFDAPLGVTVQKRKLMMHGLSTPDPDLDIRMLLNEAERTVIGIAWFLALHALQPKEQRAVLILDDPASGFDEVNKAAFVATLRSMLHMLRPKQFLITTHDDVLLGLLEEEFGEVGGWPAEVGVLRCKRQSDGSSICESSAPERPPEKTDLARELRMLNFEEHDLQAPA